MTTIKISFNITDLTNDPLEDYNCNICLENIYKKELRQCKEGHDACLSCWEKFFKKKKQCMVCGIQINSINELSRALFKEQQLSRKVIKCPYSFINILGFKSKEALIEDLDNGCNQSITIENLEYHLSNCEHRFLKCNNVGCDEVIRKNKYIEHQDSCGYELMECQYCNKSIAKYILLQHYDECPSVSIKCPSCDSNFQRSKLNQHIENECENTIIKCKYFNYGCNQYQIKRKELNQHLIDINHSIEIGKYIEELNENISKLNNQVNILSQIKHKYSNKWIIQKYSNKKNSEDEIISPIFIIGNLEFQLVLFPNYNNSNRVSLFLNNLNSFTISLSYSFKIINHLKNQHLIININDNCNTEGKEKIIKSELINQENGWLNSNDSLIIEFTIKFKESNLLTE